MGWPLSKGARASRDTDKPKAEVNLKEYGQPSWDAKTIRLDVTPEDRGHAISHPLLGWPDFARLSGDNGGVHLTQEAFEKAPHCKLGPRAPYTRKAGVDPASIALAEAGAMNVNPREFHILL